MHSSLFILVSVFTFSAVVPSLQGISVVSRWGWNARAPKSTEPQPTPVSYIFIHHSEGSEPTTLEAGKRTVRGIQNFHMDTNNWADIGYSFLIGGDGTVFEGRGWNKQGAHTQGYNSVGYGICFMGSFMNRIPSQAAINSARALINDGVAQGYVRSNYILKGHRQMKSTDCPGNALFNLIQGWPHFSS